MGRQWFSHIDSLHIVDLSTRVFVNTFAMMWVNGSQKQDMVLGQLDGGKNWKDGNRILGDGKTWNGLIGGLHQDSCA